MWRFGNSKTAINQLSGVWRCAFSPGNTSSWPMAVLNQATHVEIAPPLNSCERPKLRLNHPLVKTSILVTLLLFPPAPPVLPNVEAAEFSNIAVLGALPHGMGLASRFKTDIGITNDAAVIFADDFESDT